jgi:hypothetical protein
MNTKLLDAQGRPADNSRERYVIVSDDGLNVLDDPVRKCPWWTYNKTEAKRMKKNISRDFKRTVHVHTLEEAVVIVAKRRYGLELKPPHNLHHIESQIIEHLIKTPDATKN